jgi:hypothetical protein
MELNLLLNAVIQLLYLNNRDWKVRILLSAVQLLHLFNAIPIQRHMLYDRHYFGNFSYHHKLKFKLILGLF